MKADLKEDLKKVKKPILGLKLALKKIRNKKVSRVYVSSNSHAQEQLKLLCENSGVELCLVPENSKELGTICKKPFSVSVISFE